MKRRNPKHGQEEKRLNDINCWDPFQEKEEGGDQPNDNDPPALCKP